MNCIEFWQRDMTKPDRASFIHSVDNTAMLNSSTWQAPIMHSDLQMSPAFPSVKHPTPSSLDPLWPWTASSLVTLPFLLSTGVWPEMDLPRLLKMFDTAMETSTIPHWPYPMLGSRTVVCLSVWPRTRQEQLIAAPSLWPCQEVSWELLNNLYSSLSACMVLREQAKSYTFCKRCGILAFLMHAIFNFKFLNA